MGKAIGIDLGTTYSAVAILKNGAPKILMNRECQNITPSVVFFQEIDGVDEPIVGVEAKNQAKLEPQNVVDYIKRQMGNSDYMYKSPSGNVYSPEEISAIILKRLKEDAELILGEPVTDAVISVPAYFDDARRTATRQAGEIAGLNVLRIINEPTAAALAYGLDISENEIVFVYDLGGGTFDVTIMKINNGEFDVIATDGDRNLGGFDFDNEIIKYFQSELLAQGVNVPDDELFNAVLRDKAENAKKTLTTSSQTYVAITADGKNHRILFTREKFKEITEELLERTEMLCRSVLRSANMTWNDIDKILLVGGSTKMVMVRELVERISGKKSENDFNPDEAVALGAAIQAAISVAHTADEAITEFKAPVISDVTSQALGVVMVNANNKEENVVIIPRNSKIPCSNSKIGSTVCDNQESLLIQVTQGDDTDVNYVSVIGTGTLSIPPYPKGAEVRISYNYDIDQTVFVEVFDLTANKSLGTFEIDRIHNMNEYELSEAIVKIDKINVN